jgi:hypothetical protein
MSDDIKSLSRSVDGAGQALGVGRTKVMSLLRSGRLSAVVMDKRIYVTMQSIEALHATLPAYRPGQMPENEGCRHMPNPGWLRRRRLGSKTISQTSQAGPGRFSCRRRGRHRESRSSERFVAKRYLETARSARSLLRQRFPSWHCS